MTPDKSGAQDSVAEILVNRTCPGLRLDISDFIYWSPMDKPDLYVQGGCVNFGGPDMSIPEAGHIRFILLESDHLGRTCLDISRKLA
jgi:hypothetical protein